MFCYSVEGFTVWSLGTFHPVCVFLCQSARRISSCELRSVVLAPERPLRASNCPLSSPGSRLVRKSGTGSLDLVRVWFCSKGNMKIQNVSCRIKIKLRGHQNLLKGRLSRPLVAGCRRVDEVRTELKTTSMPQIIFSSHFRQF